MTREIVSALNKTIKFNIIFHSFSQTNFVDCALTPSIYFMELLVHFVVKHTKESLRMKDV